jgi:glutamate 5-kinase
MVRLPTSSKSSDQIHVILIYRLVSSAGSSLGTGGMSTKIVAAKLATSAGVTTIITRSSNPGNIANIVSYIQSQKPPSTSTSIPSTPSPGRLTASAPQKPTTTSSPLQISTTQKSIDEALLKSTQNLDVKGDKPVAPLHTRFIASPSPIRDRYFWLLHGLHPHGTIYIDSGAHRALANKAGLLPVGVVDVEGSFAQQEAVRLVVVERTNTLSTGTSTGKGWEGSGIEVGRALANYSAAEVLRIKGVRSGEIQGVLGYADSEYVALRENISFFERESRPVTPSLEL